MRKKINHRHRRAEKLSEAVSDDLPIAWEAERGDTPTLRRQLSGLRHLDEIRKAHRAIAADFERGFDAGLFRWGHLLALEKVGEGGFGEVFRALDTRLQREVALKLGRAGAPDSGDDERANRRFLEEARNLARVRHSNVLVVHGADVHDGRAGLWTDFVRGKTLALRISEAGSIGMEEAARVGVALCRALTAVHAAGLLHGDVKASNVMREEGGRILLMDFGSVRGRRHADDRGTASAQAYGTPLVLSPEVLRGETPTPASDLYSLGVLLFQLLTGSFPVPALNREQLLERHQQGDSVPLRDLRPDLDPAFAEAIERALAREPSARYASAEEMERGIIAAAPSAFDPNERRQSFRSVLEELGEVPEEMCRRLGREAARSLIGIHAFGGAAGKLDLEHIWLRPDGKVELDVRPTARAGSTAKEGAIGPESGDLRALCAALFELASGRPWREPAGDDPGPAARDAPPAFPQEFFRSALTGEGPKMRSAEDLFRCLTEGEKSVWWRERRRSLRAAARRPVPRLRIPRETKLHGREAELDRLRAAFDAAASGQGQVILLEGEAGIGKTRLVDEWIAALAGDGRELNFLHGSFPPGGAATAEGAFLTAYRAHLGEERLEETLSDYLASAPLSIRPFASLLRGESAEAGENSMTKGSLQTAFVLLTEALAKERVTIVLIDDLHFGPPEGLSLFIALALAVPEQRVLLIGATRPGLPPSWRAELARREHFTHLVLPRLSSRDVERILREVLGSAHLAQWLAPDLAARSDGTPLFVLENLRALEINQFVQRDPGGRSIVGEVPRRFPIPSTLAHLIQARFAGLEEEDKELLDLACCCGFEFDPTLVADAAGVGTIAALKRFARIEKRHGLIRSSGRMYSFDHHQVQEALYEGLFERLREQYHAALARSLERREGARSVAPEAVDGSLAVSLTEHYFRAGRGEEALRYLERALDHLGPIRASGTIGLVERALDYPGLVSGRRRFQLLDRRSRLCIWLGDPVREEASLLEMLELADVLADPLLRAHARNRLGAFLTRTGKFGPARIRFEEALVYAQESGSPEMETDIHSGIAGAFNGQGRHDDALAQLDRALEAARRAGDRADLPRIFCMIGIVLADLRRFDEAERHLVAFMQETRRRGKKADEVIALGNLASTLVEAQRIEEALPVANEQLEICRACGFRDGETLATFVLAVIHERLGHLGEALLLYRWCVRLAGRIADRVHEQGALGGEGLTLTLLGRLEEASRSYHRGLELARELGNPRWEAVALQGLGTIAARSGERERAFELYGRAETIFTDIASAFNLASVSHDLGALLQSEGRFAESERKLEDAIRHARASNDGDAEMLALARLAVRPGGPFGAALDAFEALAPCLSHVTRMEAAFLLWQAGGNRAHLELSQGMLRDLRLRAPEEDRDWMVERVPLYGRIESAGSDPCLPEITFAPPASP